ELGLCDGSAVSLQEICKAHGVSDDTIEIVTESGMEKIAAFLSNPVVSGLLIAIGVVGLLFELLTAGIGAAGIIGVSAWVLYFAGHALLDNIGWMAIVFFIVGLAFIILEAFVIPGFGIAGVAGIAAILFSVFLIAPSVESGLITIGVALAAAVLLMVISMKNKKTRSLWRKLVLKDRTDAENGYTSPNMDNSSYLGKEGVALSPLRPAGAIDIDGDRVDVVTEGDFLAAGSKVKVIGLDGTRIIVRLVK
ncbi:MAG: NfeD family protein, partial [Bacillota bacterium]|nr:NfeD family protein [Bacillota bacterium]